MPQLGPPLRRSEGVLGKHELLAGIILKGLTGPIKVNGEQYVPLAGMPGLSETDLSDDDFADIMTYVRHAWNNHGGAVEARLVESQRKRLSDRKHPFTAEDLVRIRTH